MTKVAKRMTGVADSYNKMETYSLEDAVKLLAGFPKAKFDETVEIAMNLGVDPKYADQIVRGMVALPHGTGKTVRVAVFAKGDKQKEAKDAGADFVGAEDLVEKVKGGFFEFDKVVATPDCMPLVGQIGKLLGPKGLMPNPKLGTVTPNVGPVIKNLKSGMIEFKVEKNGIVHAGVGKMSFSADKLNENIAAFVQAIKSAKPTGAKGVYMQRMAISSTMSPAVKVDISSIS